MSKTIRWISTLLLLNAILVCAIILCSGTSLAHLLLRDNGDRISYREVSLKSDDQAQAQGFLLGLLHRPDEGLCVSVDQRQFWEPNIKPRVLQSTLIHNLKIYLSERLMGRHFAEVMSGLIGEFSMTDSQGNVIGSYSAPFSACFSTVLLPPGCYTALIHERGVSGQAENYSFQLCIHPRENA